MYMWLKQILVFYIVCTLVINAVVSDRYKKYIRLITGLIMLLIVLGPIIRLTGSTDLIEKQLKGLYTYGYGSYYKDKKAYGAVSLDTEAYSYTLEDVVKKTVKLKINNILDEYDVTASDIEVDVDKKSSNGSVNHSNKGNINDSSIDDAYTSYNKESIKIRKIIVKIKKMNKSDIEDVKEKISEAVGVNTDNIYILREW